MITKQVYICETCGKQSFNKDEILCCEAAHLGLTADEMSEWEGLKSQVHLYQRMSRTNNEATMSLRWITAALGAFERRHHLSAAH